MEWDFQQAADELRDSWRDECAARAELGMRPITYNEFMEQRAYALIKKIKETDHG
jgi:hypothetical protein